MKEALFYKKLKDKEVQCQLCPRFCVIKPGNRGNCGVRENTNGKLYSLVYGKPVSIALDPIEKKPLYHFLPGQQALSIATAGCNLHCLYCQNWEISQCRPEKVASFSMPPKRVIEEAINREVNIISYTYTEPTIFFEYMIDIAKLAREKKIRNTIVTNGFINSEPLTELCKYLDGSNIDFKGSDEFYKKLSGAWRKPVEEAIKIMHEKGIWLELTNLIIPGYNDKEKNILEIINWIKENLSVDVPLHLSAFYPTYKMLETPATKPEIVIKARKIAMKAGLRYVYTGNIPDKEGSTTFCPGCKKPVIIRQGFYIKENRLIDGRCPECGEKIAGVWK
ncbi:MAG: AmmeMemoRadiSam system radical SAM enzyme [Candidatus Pacearchaeota archaeon]|nr:MAG: AmmeMemoRadiSam system radical SAM enzyme [Candidatus Pacearchaeota archaeon]